MIDPLAAATSLHGARLAQQPTPASQRTHGGASFAGELARYVASSTGATASTATTSARAPARPQAERTEKVEGHPYALVSNGADKGRFLNELDGSPREGRVFRLVERDERVFHVYGSGKEKVVVEVKPRAKADSAAAQPTGGTAPGTAS